jgi:hypothetical protein
MAFRSQAASMVSQKAAASRGWRSASRNAQTRMPEKSAKPTRPSSAKMESTKLWGAAPV